MNKSEIERGYRAVVEELTDRAELIYSERGRNSIRGAVCQALDDGYIYDDDRATVLAWALECGLVKYGVEVDWVAVEQSLIDELEAELKLRVRAGK